MKKLSNNEAELKKRVAYEKSIVLLHFQRNGGIFFPYFQQFF